MALRATEVTLGLDFTLDTLVQVYVPPPPGRDEWDEPDDGWEEEVEEGTHRTMTVGDLLVRRLIEQAGPELTASVRARLLAITDQELTAYVRARIAGVLGATEPGEMTGDDLTLAVRIESEYRRQLSDPASGGFAHSKDVPVVSAIIQTAVTTAFRDLPSTVVAEIRDRALAEIAAHARSGQDLIPPGG